jgi:Fe-S-cluster-containing dehydrogenase component
MKKLFIDVTNLRKSDTPLENIKCEYLFHDDNRGIFSLLEVAEFAVYCRQCKDAFCVSACPREALEHQENGTIKRYNMRCVGCKSCVLACPFGTIFPEVLNYISSKCDNCLNQLEEAPGYTPACVLTAPKNSFSMVEINHDDSDKNIFLVGEHLAVKSHNWRKREGRI